MFFFVTYFDKHSMVDGLVNKVYRRLAHTEDQLKMIIEN